MKLREKDLEDLLFHHPYLIDEIFLQVSPQKIRRQVERNRDRLDLQFDLPVGLCIAELKITRLTTTDVNQLIRYCKAWSKTAKLAPVHFLVGKRPANDDEIRQTINAGKFKIKICYLDVVLPAQLVFDENLRRYRKWQPGDAAQNILELRF